MSVRRGEPILETFGWIVGAVIVISVLATFIKAGIKILLWVWS